MKPIDAPMTLERFCELAESYGGAIARWPQAERPPAEALLQEVPELSMIVARERDLDDLLFGSTIPSPPAALARRIIAQAPQPKAEPSGALRRWLSGLAAMGVLASGAAVGAAVVALSPAGQVDSLNGIYDHAGLSEIAAAGPSRTSSSQASGL
ncbi:MAG: hypothetical protein ACYDD1_01385 [Caulobacteraceae bacterium]